MASPQKEKELLTTKELLAWLVISVSCLNAWKRENRIPYSRLGRKIYYKKSEVLSALEKSNYAKLQSLK